MNRPWVHVAALVPRFANVQSKEWLARRVRRIYRSAAELKRVALEEGVPIDRVFAGARIRESTVLSPSQEAYCVSRSCSGGGADAGGGRGRGASGRSCLPVGEVGRGETERGDGRDERRERDQRCAVCGVVRQKGAVDGDVGVEGLCDAYIAGCVMGLNLDSLDLFQAPHHGSRANVSADMLDLWPGAVMDEPGSPSGVVAVVSANANDKDHRSRAVVRALIHRGCSVYQTQGVYEYGTAGAPARGRGWTAAK